MKDFIVWIGPSKFIGEDDAPPLPPFTTGDWSVSDAGIQVDSWSGEGNLDDIEYRFRLKAHG